MGTSVLIGQENEGLEDMIILKSNLFLHLCIALTFSQQKGIVYGYKKRGRRDLYFSLFYHFPLFFVKRGKLGRSEPEHNHICITKMKTP